MYINCCDNTEGEYKKPMNHFKIPKKEKTNQKNKNKKTKETKLLRHRNSKVENIMLLLLIKTKNLLFVCLFLFTFMGGVMKPRNILLRYGDLPVALAKINLCEKLITT